MSHDQKVIDQWSANAPFWEKHREAIQQMFAPVTEALSADGGIGRGHTVLDVATGAGEPALSLAALVGAEGQVVGIDPIPGMVAAARRAAEQQGLGNVQFEVASAEQLPFTDDRFDAVVCRFGSMFFPAPLDAIREMLRVLKPGGKLALAAWDFAENNPYFWTLSRVIERHAPAPPPEPDAKDAFRFASPGKLRSIVAQAGALDTSERLLRFAISARLTVEEFWMLRHEMSDKMRSTVATFSAEQAAEVKAEALEILREYSGEEGIGFPAQVLMISGRKRRS